ncbi:DUF4136 domain-containing protein [Maribacter sp. 1_MG-2023]|uniref:DUF4136 domain-containing protein n=1 Tax=Maribacter sp. 1_MG-2023 TaxID=3062677 RepID=UPI0026E247D4|nr:DUF4136 domain-containing protein [Maribacter sp. 1_MG-2023]MDO6473736.1 DUF4136 domain-containing protein [Maribacter sp. 1_MG-2023]
MKKLITFTMVIITGLFFQSCYKSPTTNSLSSDLVVATNRDLQADYSDYETYHISDTIPRISDSETDTILVGAGADQIIAKIKANLDARGYRFVERSDNPDLAVIPSIIDVEVVNQICSGWWGGYPGYWDPYYWGYPGYGYYYPYCGFYTYDTGSLNVELFDLENADENKNLKAVWGSAMFGILSSSDRTNLTRALTAIDQSFEQSPYLTNK